MKLLPAAWLLALGLITACSDEALGPDRQMDIHLLDGIVADSITGSPGDTLHLSFQVLDLDGAAVSAASVRFAVQGEGAELSSTAAVSGIDGTFTLTWRLGFLASEQQQLAVEVRYAGRVQTLLLSGTVVPTDVAALEAPDSVATRLHSPSALTVVAIDPYGNVFTPQSVMYTSTDTSVFAIDSGGMLQGRSRGIAKAIARSGDRADTTSIHIFQVAGSIEVPDSLQLHSRGQTATIGYGILSDGGHEIRDTLPLFALSDTMVATLVGGPSDSAVSVRAVGNGSAVLTITVGNIERDVRIVVSQKSFSLSLTPSALPAFDALGDSVQLHATAVDSMGIALDSPRFSFSAADSSIVSVSPAGWVRSTGNGTTTVRAQEITGGTASLPATVSQVPDSLEVFWTDTAAIKSAAALIPPPLTCLSRDRNGYPLPASPSVSSRTGTLFGTNCATLTVRASGYDTMTFTAGSKTVELAHVLAVRPLVSSATGEFVTLDSFPVDYRLWAPSGRTNSLGETELYLTGYRYVPDSNGVGPGALHRLVSSDGLNFRYDGVALNLVPPPCGLICSGIENIAVIPRDDGPGWRMLFAAGTTGTYGWQVFSAVSSDERNWTMEPGVRIANGGPVPPASSGTVPWPVGEGMVIDRLPGGEWRMVVGGYEPIANAPDRFEIVEYRSVDQLTWTYQGVRLAAAQMPASAQRTIYSPSIVQITPGLWRMFVSGDDLNLPGGRSRIFTAVSQDRSRWQFEAELVSAPGIDFYYTAVVGDRLYFLRQDAGQLRRLAAITLVMP